MKRIISLIISLAIICSIKVPKAYALDGVWHNPYGNNCIYDIDSTERTPRNPVAGETVLIRSTTWAIESGQTVWVTYTKNGIKQQDIGAEWKYNQGNNTYWEVNLGTFAKGDVVEYTVWAGKDGGNFKQIGPFNFNVTDWESVASVELISSDNGIIKFSATANIGSFMPALALTFPNEKILRLELSPKDNSTFEAGIPTYNVTNEANKVIITTSALRVTVTKNPYEIEVFDIEKNEVISGDNNELSWMTDGNDIITKVRSGFSSPSNEQFLGFGERYNGIAKRGQVMETYVYNQYRNQGDRTYMAVPFFYSTNGYGLYVNSTYYSKFDMASSNQNKYFFEVDTKGDASGKLDYYFISGQTADEVIGGYTAITGLPQQMPKWAFGLWMSANEWDRQSEVLGAMTNAVNYDIPASVVVLEQWSDENTFYIWNEATYSAKNGAEAFSSTDFNYGSKWPNPKAMVDALHDNNMKVLLWQVPIQKSTSYQYEQKDNDEAYMISQGYAVKNGDGSPYRIPENGWFGNSLLLDFTNQEAVNWWMSKRGYLFDDIGIDGFKTDGGEMVWGKETTFSDGTKGPEMRNKYPNDYIKGYNDFAQAKTGEGVTFSRAGTSGVQKTGAFWAGDQESSFAAFKEAVSAGINSGVSGIPFWGWDLAGFTGNFPSAELYKRSTSMSTFIPIMQFHSEKNNPSPSEERSPWNVQERTGDTSVIPMFSKYANIRMNILPYIYSESVVSANTGAPMMRAMALDFSEDVNTYTLDEQYMFGHNMLVAPILQEGQTTKDVYLPEGEWVDFFNNALSTGGVTKSYYANVDQIPVFVKNGSIIPLNLNNGYELGGSIGNDVDNYTNLTFRIYPKGDSNFTLVNSDRSQMTVTASEDFANEKVTVNIPNSSVAVTTQIFGSKPSLVKVNGSSIAALNSISEISKATSGYYYNKEEKLTYVKTPSGNSQIVLGGIYKAPLEAEHSNQTNVSVNTNHLDYYGQGFVDSFAEVGDSIEFNVYSSINTQKNIEIRYCAGTENGKRTVSVNGVSSSVIFGKTADWDTWGVVTLPINLVKGNNRVKISYESLDFSGINVDCIFVK